MPIQKGRCNLAIMNEYRGALKNKKPLDPADEQNIMDKVVVITGANSGVGAAAALEFAKRGAVVVMPCRNVAKAKGVLEDIKSKVPDAKLDLLQLDLGDLSSVRKCAQEIREKYTKIDILVNNAGFTSYSKTLENTTDGLETHMAVNHLGPLLFTHLLLDLVKKAAPSRIIFTSSMGYQMGELDPEDFMLEKRGNFVSDFGAYCNSKLATNYCVKILGKKLAGTGVTVYALCPGHVKSGFQAEGGIFLRIMTNAVGNTPAEGAENILYCALMNSTANQTGLMYHTNSVWEGTMEQLDDDIGQQIWDKSLDYIQDSSQVILTELHTPPKLLNRNSIVNYHLLIHSNERFKSDFHEHFLIVKKIT